MVYKGYFRVIGGHDRKRNILLDMIIILARGFAEMLDEAVNLKSDLEGPPDDMAD